MFVLNSITSLIYIYNRLDHFRVLFLLWINMLIYLLIRHLQRFSWRPFIFCMSILGFVVKLIQQNPEYGRQRISRPLRIAGSIQFWRDCLIYLLKKKINPEQLLVFKALQIGPQMHQSTSLTPRTRGPSTGAIWNNSSLLRLYKSVDECTSPQVKHLPRVDNPCMQFRTTPSF